MMKKINVMSRKLIKPSTPTPLHLNKYKISFIDELSPPCNINVLLFYPSPPIAKTLFITHLEDSLANILPRFYPLAGRYVESDRSVDCNDEGAEFVLAEASEIELADLTTKSVDDDELTDLLSRQFYEADGPTDPLLSIQITRLKLDDVAIGISVSHRVFDASSLGTFVSTWSNTAVIIAPSFDPPSFFPAKNIGHGYVLLTGKNPNIVVKRVLFCKEDIDKLRSKIINGGGEPKKVFVSRVRLVSAFIAKALMRMDRAKHGNRSGACFKIYLPVNIRERTIPPLPKYSCGNLVVTSVAETKKVVRFEDLVYMLGESIGKTVTVIGQTLALGMEGHKLIMDSSVNNRSMSTDIALMVTDWSKFGFYEADFGWGKPVFVGFGAMPVPYATTLVNNKNGDGIEAWVHVNRGDLTSLERYVHLSQMDSEDF